MRGVLLSFLIALLLVHVNAPAWAHGFVAIIRNETPLEVGVRWSVGSDLASQTGDIDTKDLSARIKPNNNAGFSPGFGNWVHYKLYVFDPAKKKWTQFDYDQVLLNRERYGLVTKIGENAVDWLQAWDPTDWFIRKK